MCMNADNTPLKNEGQLSHKTIMDSQTSSSSCICSSDGSWTFDLQLKIDELEQAPTT